MRTRFHELRDRLAIARALNAATSMNTYKLLLLPGDGIGPEVMAEVEKVINFFNHEGTARFETETGLVGGCAYDAHGKPLVKADMALAHATTWSCSPRSAGQSGRVFLTT